MNAFCSPASQNNIAGLLSICKQSTLRSIRQAQAHIDIEISDGARRRDEHTIIHRHFVAVVTETSGRLVGSLEETDAL